MNDDYSFYHDRLKNHILEVICDHERVKCFRLCEEIGKNCMSTFITFNPYSIMLNGDLTPGQNGNVSACGYGIEWFAKDLGVSYLTGKFALKESWDSGKSTEEFRRITSEKNLMECFGDEEVAEMMAKAAQAEHDHLWCGDSFESEKSYHEALEAVFDDGWWECASLAWYNEGEVGWLTAIQTAFAREYNKMKESEAPKGPDLVIDRG